MANSCIYELNADHDQFPGLLQDQEDNPQDARAWEKMMAVRSIKQGEQCFGSDYTPVRLVFNKHGRRKPPVGDISSWMRPFIVFSDKARMTLSGFLAPAGQFLEVDAPLPGFIGFHPQIRLQDCIDLEKSVCTKYPTGGVVIRKPAMYEQKVRGHDIFTVKEIPTGLYVSAAFKAAVDAAQLKGFDFSREVPLV